jgi:hypothetical protein
MTILNVSEDTLTLLAKLTDASNFEPTPDGMYMGIGDLAEREAAARVIKTMISSIQTEIQSTPSKEFVLNEFASALNQLDLFDTEDREKACEYCEKVMDVLAIESSDGFLNN